MSKRGREAETEAGAAADADTAAAPIPMPLVAQHGPADERQQQGEEEEQQQHRAAALRGLILAEGGGACCAGGGGGSGGGVHQHHQHGADAGAEIVRTEGGEAGPDAAAAAEAGPNAAAAAAAGEWMVSPSLKLPQGVILHVLSFLDGRALAACAQVCRELYEASDYAELWATAARAAYLQAAVLGDKQSYGGEWKALLRDGNRRNRSALFEWEVANCLGDARRRYSPAFELEDYTFQLIVDPNGNPYVPLGHPGVSVYLTCCPTRFVRGVAADGRLEVDIVATNQPIPPPAPPQNEEDEEAPPLPPPQRIPWECCCAFGLAVLARPQQQQQQGQGQGQGGPGLVRRDLMWTSNLHEDRFDNQTREWGVHRLISLRRLQEANNGYLDDSGALRIQARLRLSHYRVKLFTSAALKAHKNGFGVADLAYRGPRLQPPTRSLAAASAAALAAATNPDLPSNFSTKEEAVETPPLFWTYDVFQSTTVAAFTALVAKDLGLLSPARLRLWAVTQPWADSPSAPRELLRPLLPPDHPLAILHQQVLAQQGLGPAAVGALLADQEMTLAVALHAHQDGVGEVRVWAEVSGNGGWQWSDLAVGAGEPSEPAAASVGFDVEEEAAGPQEAAWTGASGGAAGAAMQAALDAAEGAGDMEEAAAAAASQEGPPPPPSRRWKRVRPPRLVATAPGGALSAAVRILPDPQDPLEIAAVAAEVVALQEQQEADEQGEAVDPGVVPPPPGLMVLEQLGAEPALEPALPEEQQQDAAAGTAVGEDEEPGEDDDDEGQPPPCVLLFIKHLRGAADPNNETRQPQPPSLEYLTHVFLPVTAPVRSIFDALVPLAAGPDADPAGFSLMVEAPPSAWQPAPEPTTPPTSSSSSNDIGGGDAGSSSSSSSSSSSLGYPTRLRCFDCPPSPAAADAAPPTKKPRQAAPAKPPRTVRALRVENGQILVLHRKGQEGTLRGLYQGFTEQLLKETAALLAYTGPSAGVEPRARACPVDVMRSVSGVSVRPRGSRLRPRTSADALVDLFERLGNQRFRVRNTALERQHTSARETLEYASVGRHLGFCCDRCGATDFTGPRYKCTRCVDYDLCYQCRVLPVERHRYRFGGRRWTKEDYSEHNDNHTMVVIHALPHDAGLLRRFAPV